MREATKPYPHPSQRSVFDVGEWEVQPSGNVLMTMHYTKLKKHLFIPPERKKKGVALGNGAIYTFKGYFYQLVTIWKRESGNYMIELKPISTEEVAYKAVMLIPRPENDFTAVFALKKFIYEKMRTNE